MGKPVLIYMGTPEFAVPPLEALCEAGLPPAVVYSQPDRPRGRGRKVFPTPVAEAARRLGLEIRQPEVLQTRDEREQLEALQPDLILTVAYGKILRRRWLKLPRVGAVNLHPSPLPRYRGMNPMGRTLMRGDAWTGVSGFLMDEGTDTGPILKQILTPVDPMETLGDLSRRLARLGGGLLIDIVKEAMEGSLQPVAQDEDLATIAAPFDTEESHLSWRQPAIHIHNRIRAMSPDPGVIVRWRDRCCKILRSRPLDEIQHPEPPGQMLPGLKGHPPRVVCRPGLIELLEIQPEGKAVIPGEAWYRGCRALDGPVFLEEI
ncbi:MAG: methionyl-tRNA formyltransferase [Candidatus Eisenbacteria bacterium]|uniref:Methionyl-tRNA formyltransferase n=1 Tax=Eiseniibacteriota bacterium TaxID=2212470 RepID=A0A948W3P6_UNCEI|nr:methionyl-tRNA formyltransferase [Candidatus Eisenbacteria bacterium]MBU1950101.1 methionyl-tRNA formyltransferase [Candidatus Eisenbacteria bacterium]MBU2691327.1 methionyl-tRNA formyltransferase [Candidatus Eisenbacteria bacterium]